MNFAEKLSLAHSKLFTTQIAEEINTHPKRMEELMDIFKKGPKELQQRAAWVVSVVAEKNPHLLQKYLRLFIELLGQPGKHDAINRGICRSLQFMAIPEKHEGKVLDLMFLLMRSGKEPIAVKVFAMQVAANLSEKYPDIAPELKSTITAMLPDGSAGIKSRGKNILKRMEKI